jgi:hypothetical protein
VLYYNVEKGAVPPGVKRPGCETDHPPPFIVKVRIVALYLHSSIRLIAAVLN